MEQKKTYKISGSSHNTDFGTEEVFTTLRGAKQRATAKFKHLAATVVIYRVAGDDEVQVAARTFGQEWPGPSGWEATPAY